MKKLTALTLALLLLVLTACSGTPVIAPPKDQTPPTQEDVQPETPDVPADGSAVKTGLVVLPSVASSKDAGEENGVAQSDITLVAVLVDESGVIVDCVIDAIQAKIQFTAAGKIASDLTAPVLTKNELGTDYGMGQWSPIGKEWNEQAGALASYAVGKTVAELQGIALGEKGQPAEGTDLAASCTMSVAGLVDAVAQAVESAQHLGAQSGDVLTLSATAGISGSADVGEKDGLAQTDATVAAISFNGETITSCAIDAVQANVNFDANGKIVSDLTVAPLTKNQLGADYGMAQWSPIGREWNQQAAAFAQYITGKTVAKVNGIALNEKGAAAPDTDLATSCTINLYGFLSLVNKAAGPVKTGLVILPSVGASKDAGEENGVAQSDITLVAVLVDESGVIVDCVIDAIQAKIQFTAAGKIASDLTAPVLTKNELGTDYGMGQWSPIGKEWNEQAEALASYAVGKTVAELQGIALGEKGQPAEGTDLAASCTMSVAGLVDAVVQAVESAQHLGAQSGDKLTLSATAGISGSADVGEKDGLAQTDATVAAISFNGETITSCAIDAVQANVNFDANGKITTDLTVAPLTKNQLGADYGMAQWSPIGKEWNQQAAAFAQYITGKTVAEVNGIALNEKGAAAPDTDLATSCTINLYGFQALVNKAEALR